MTQRIIYESPDSLKTKRNWFGDRAIEMALKISKVIGPYMQKTYPSLRHNYQTLFVAQLDRDEKDGRERIAYRRILSNLIPGCPIFYAVRVDRLGVPLNDFGFRYDAVATEQQMDLMHKIIMSKGPGEQIRTYPVGKDCLVVETQKVIAKRTLGDDQLIHVFGTEVLDVLSRLNRIAMRIETEDGRPAAYWPFIVSQYDNASDIYFEGIVLTNLVKGCPIIYPRYAKDFAANRSGGFKSVILSDNLKNKIARLDLTGCSLQPSLPTK